MRISHEESFSSQQIISSLCKAKAGVSARELCRKHAISDDTFYTCRKKFGCMEVPEVKRLKELAEENTSLRKQLAEAMLDKKVFHVTRILDSIALFRGYPAKLRVGQFICRALGQWAFDHGVELRLIQPGLPTQNEFIESFNGRFRDECLNKHYFSNVLHARKIIND